MFTNLKRKILPFVLAGSVIASSMSCPALAATKANVNTATNKEIVIHPGEVAKIPIIIKQVGIHTDAVFPGASGEVEVTVNGSQVNYWITMYTPANSFTGHMNIQDTTTGFNAGFAMLDKFHDSVKYSSFSNHKYSASMGGYAYLDGEMVAYVTPGVNITWTD